VPPQQSTPEFETAVLDAFVAALLRYCAAVHDGRSTVDDQSPVVVVTVVTAWSVPGLHPELDPRARRILSRELAGARLHSVVFAVDPDLPAPHHHVEVRTWQHRPTARDEVPLRHRLLVLTLTYENHHRFVFPLGTAQAWLPFRRGRPATDDRHEVLLPDYLYAVPAGPLLRLRYWDGALDLTRTAVKGRYAVEIDGRALDLGTQARLCGRGRIAYTDGPARTVLDYFVTERE
jgi:hypothetical protein